MQKRPVSVRYDFAPQNLPADFLQALGHVVAAATHMESVVEMLIGGCLGIDSEYTTAVVTHMAAPLRGHVAKAVAELKIDDVEALNQLDIILSQIDSAQAKRNELIHHLWAVHPDTGDVYQMKKSARGSVAVSTEKKSAESVKKDAEFIHHAGTVLMLFLMEQKLIPSLPPYRPRGHKLKKVRSKKQAAE